MFITPLLVEALDEEDKWRLVWALIWLDDPDYIVVPAGFITDLASIPAPMRGILDTNGRSRRAAVLHDYLYSVGRITRKEADRLFLTALIADGVLSIARGMYYMGVRLGGWIPWNRYRNTEKELEENRIIDRIGEP